MVGYIFVILILSVLVVMQVFLSLRSNKYWGLIIPCINLIGSVFISVMFSDMFVAFLCFIASIIPMILWLSIYNACRKKVEKKKENEINRMRINDL